MKFSVGDRVRLPATETTPDEFGTVVDVDRDMLSIQIDPEFRDPDSDEWEPDDGERSAHVSNVRRA